MSNHVEVKNIEPTTFEDHYYDEYEYYNLTDRYTGRLSRALYVIVVVIIIIRLLWNFYELYVK